MQISIFVALLSLALISKTVATQRLKEHLLTKYNKNVKPDGQVTVTMGMNPKRLELCPKTETLSLLSWNTISWTDERLAWDPTEWDDIKSITIEDDQLWLPDLVLFHEVEGSKLLEKYLVIVSSDGSMMYVPAVSTKVFCKPNYDLWPYGKQNCTFRIGSWHHEKKDIDVAPKIWDSTEYPLQSQIELLNVSNTRGETDYAPYGSYPYLSISIEFQRKQFYHNGILSTLASELDKVAYQPLEQNE